MSARTRAAWWVVLLAALSARAERDDLAALKKQWPQLERSGKIDACTRLLGKADAQVLRLCEDLLSREDDPVVEGELVRLIAAHAVAVPELRARAARALVRRADALLDARAKKEKAEFDAVCREFGRTIPPGGAQGEGRDWVDPWDEERRTLPEETRHERLRARALVEALRTIGKPEATAPLMRFLEEHHDPEVVVAAVRAVGELHVWGALPALADLVRIQEQGRALGGADVIGREPYETLRLKWDVHKDRLWWSRPEYLPRARLPILEEAGRIVGRDAFRDARGLDRWLLANEELLGRRGVQLSPTFKSRAAASAR